MKKYLFNYKPTQNDFFAQAVERKHLPPGEPTYQELLALHDGQVCEVQIEHADPEFNIVTAYFKDGSDLDVYINELTEIE